MKLITQGALLICLFTGAMMQAQQRNVATFRNITISEEEFKSRFDLTPRLGSSDFLIDSLKMEFLSTLLAEKMWAAEAIQRGYDTLPIVRKSLLPIEKMLVRDALYKEEVESKIVISEKELAEARYRSNTAIIVRIVGSPDSLTAAKWFRSLQKGTPFANIVQQTKDTGTVKFVYGKMSGKKNEDIVFALKDGGYSVPVKEGNAWFIFQRIGSETIEKKKEEMTEPGNTPADLLKQRKAEAIGRPFLEKLLKGLTVQIDKDVFTAAVDAILPVLSAQKTSQQKNPNGEYCVDESHEQTIMHAVPVDKIDAVLIPLPGGPVTLRQFLTESVNTGFCTKQAEKEGVSRFIRSLINKYIEHEMLAREGYRRGLQNTEAVQKDLQMWKMNYCAQFLRNRYLDSVTVSDDEVLALYDSVYKEKSAPVVKLGEIYSTGLTVMQEAVDRLGRGEDFGDVASKLTERSGMKVKRGEYPERQITLTGELAPVIAGMRKGEIKGPVRVSDGYVMVKLIDKKASADSMPRFEALKELIQKAAATKKLFVNFNAATKDFARSFQPEINLQVMKEIKVTTVPMYTVRLVGFGGRMLAYPFSTPWENWVPAYLQNREMP